MGISLWLVPQSSSAAMTALQDVIVYLSETYSTPAFPPHVTLASLPNCISLEEIHSCLSSEAQVELSFERVSTGPTFFQSVFVDMQLSPQLSQLHQHIHKVLGVQPKTPFFPHLSLYYGNENKEDIAQKLKVDGVTRCLEDGRFAVSDVKGFLVKEIWVVNCTGRPEKWSIMEKITLKPCADPTGEGTAGVWAVK